jgi:bacteriocin leader peptide (microcyclamide/patellamide family)
MDKPNLMPQPAQPVNRVTTGQIPPELVELSEEALSQEGVSSASVLASVSGPGTYQQGFCSYDGDDAE